MSNLFGNPPAGANVWFPNSMHETYKQYMERKKHEEAKKIQNFTQDELNKYWHEKHRAEENAQYAQMEMVHERRKAEEAARRKAEEAARIAEEAARIALMKKDAALLKKRSQEPHVPPPVTSFASPFKDLSKELEAARRAHIVSKNRRGNSMKAGKRRKINRHYKSKRSNKSKSNKGKKSHRRRSTRNH